MRLRMHMKSRLDFTIYLKIRCFPSQSFKILKQKCLIRSCLRKLIPAERWRQERLKGENRGRGTSIAIAQVKDDDLTQDKLSLFGGVESRCKSISEQLNRWPNSIWNLRGKVLRLPDTWLHFWHQYYPTMSSLEKVLVCFFHCSA